MVETLASSRLTQDANQTLISIFMAFIFHNRFLFFCKKKLFFLIAHRWVWMQHSILSLAFARILFKLELSLKCAPKFLLETVF
ncbi:MAG: hypothetical protein EB068_01765, partial [Betaproteobacteria bacterium]|nr:hypothetical protein [Betaproteobacteria bacterium]